MITIAECIEDLIRLFNMDLKNYCEKQGTTVFVKLADKSGVKIKVKLFK